MITIKLLPAPSKLDYPLDINRCARWLLGNHGPKRRQASHLGVIRRTAELGGERVAFIGDDRLYTASKILELIDEDGKLKTNEDPRPMRDARLRKPAGN